MIATLCNIKLAASRSSAQMGKSDYVRHNGNFVRTAFKSLSIDFSATGALKLPGLVVRFPQNRAD